MKLLKFGAEWCAPCKSMDEQLKDFTACQIERHDVDSDNIKTLELIDKYKIRSVPTMILLDDNDNIIHIWTGSTPISQIIEEINKHK